MSANNYRYGMGRKLDYKGSVDSGFQEPIDPLVPHDPTMEINNHYMNRKDLGQSPLGSPVMDRRPVPPGMIDPQQMQSIATLKQQQQMQQQHLLFQFQQQQQQLAQEHEKQLQEHIKHQMVILQKQQEFLEQQKLEERERQRIEKEMIEKERLDMIKNKNKDEQSAVASTEVKQKLQEFVLTKKHREAAARNSPPQFRHWPVDQSSPPQAGLSPPFSHLLGKYDDDFPLRKTASEPNLKVRSALKQKVMERRITQSPILRRRDKGFLKRKTPLSIDCGSNSDSGPNSPPSGVHGGMPNGSLSSLHSKEEPSVHPYLLYRSMGYPSADLYTSPSMPNISLGRPPSSGGTSSQTNYTESELRAMSAARLGLQLTSPVIPGAIPPYHPSLPVIDGDYSPPAGYMAAHIKALENSGKIGTSPLAGPYTAPPSTQGPPEGQQARIHRHRPLGRTQSAPLPIGHPYLQQQQQNLLLQQQKQQQQQQQQQDQMIEKMYVKQHIRQAVLQRTGSKTHMENVDEETEAKLAQEMRESQEQDDDVVLVKESKMEDTQIGVEKPPRERGDFSSQQPRDIIKARHKGHHHKPLARTQSSPLVTFSNMPQAQDSGPVRYTFTTALAFDTMMQKHACSCGNNSVHPEHAGRLQSIWSRLHETNLISKCERLKCRKATIEELQSCHTEAYTLFYGTNNLNRQKLDSKLFENLPARFCMLPCGGLGVDSDTVWNDLHSSSAARMAAGCVIELALRVGAGELKNGFGVVRPPGHHAESQQAMGFCFFNNIALAARQVREKLKLKKVLIVDWDVHHGNGTQQQFYDDPNVLYISIHRHDNGNFFPGTGAPEECGAEEGLGFNVNIAFSGGLDPPKGDAEYLAAFRTIIMPIAREFNPDIVMVSAGFDAACGHPAPLGGYEVSPACFGHMTRELMSLAGGKIVLTLEGGYELTSICDASEMCARSLLGEELPPIKEEELIRPPCQAALDTLEDTIKIQAKHWPCLERYLGTIHYPLMEAQKREMDEADTVSALASLSMVAAKRGNSIEQESEPMEEES